MTGASTLEPDVARLLDAHIGLKPDVAFRPRLTRALRELAGAVGIVPADLGAALMRDPALLDDLVERVTVQETSFFRHPDQFDALARTVLPAIKAPTLRAWSAASSNGQEAYSLAMVFAEAGRAGTVLASDVSPAALRRTSAASYATREMRGVSAPRRSQHFTPDGARWRASPALRRGVLAQRHNLIDPIPRHVAACHIVMCRNVLIYFGPAHARSFLARLADAMDPAALLFVGGTETLWQVTDRFEPTPLGGCYAYRPLSRAGATTVARRARPAPRVVAPCSPSRAAGVVAPVPPVVSVDATSPVDPGVLGRRLLADGAVDEAIVAFRQWTYQAPDDPLAHLQMGVALDRRSDGASARRSYRAALAALDRAAPAAIATLLEGYDEATLRDLLRTRAADAVRTPPSDASAPTRTGRRR